MKHKYLDLSRLTLIFLTLALIFCLSGCREKDPHAGMVEIYNGTAYDWITPWKNVPVSDLEEVDFYTPDDGRTVLYNGETYRAQQGIDVSYYQGDVDWSAVAADGIEFAMIRAGYRGFTDGGISEPLVFDWETISEYDARTDAMLGAEMTACAAAFCETVRAAGCTPCVYFNQWQGYYDYDLSALTDAVFWVSNPGAWDDFYYAHSIWQYTYSGTVSGIDGNVDRNLRYVPAE